MNSNTKNIDNLEGTPLLKYILVKCGSNLNFFEDNHLFFIKSNYFYNYITNVKIYNKLLKAIQSPDTNVNVRDKYGNSILIYLTSFSIHKKIEKLLDELLKHPKLHINIRNQKGLTAFMYACQNSIDEDINEDIEKMFLKHPKLNVNVVDDDGWSALMCACRNTNTDSCDETVELLLQHPNIDVNLQTKDAQTALIIAAASSRDYSNEYTVEMLLNHPDIDVNLQDIFGNTALIKACQGSSATSTEETVRLLLNHSNINVNIQNKDGNTALMEAVLEYRFYKDNNYFEYKQLNEELINIIKKHTIDNTTIDIGFGFYANRAFWNNSTFNTILMLIEHPNIDVNIKNKYEMSVLELVCRNNQNISELVKLLLQHPNIDVNIKFKKGSTLLILLCEYMNSIDCKKPLLLNIRKILLIRDLLNLLIEHDYIDVNLKDNDKWTPLMHICNMLYSDDDSDDDDDSDSDSDNDSDDDEDHLRFINHIMPSISITPISENKLIQLGSIKEIMNHPFFGSKNLNKIVDDIIEDENNIIEFKDFYKIYYNLICIDIIDKLISKSDIDINSQNYKKQTALMYICGKTSNNDRQIYKKLYIKLIEKILKVPNININLCDTDGDSVFDGYIDKSHEIFKLLKWFNRKKSILYRYVFRKNNGTGM
jgi:ankyrin repeat protein